MFKSNRESGPGACETLCLWFPPPLVPPVICPWLWLWHKPTVFEDFRGIVPLIFVTFDPLGWEPVVFFCGFTDSGSSSCWSGSGPPSGKDRLKHKETEWKPHRFLRVLLFWRNSVTETNRSWSCGSPTARHKRAKINDLAALFFHILTVYPRVLWTCLRPHSWSPFGLYQVSNIV